MLPRACLLPLALALLLSAPGAQAQTEQDRAAARDLAQQADARIAAGNLDEAIDLFQKADALVPAPSLKLAVARLLVRKGKLVEAQILMQDIARSAPVALEPAPWARARAEAREEAEALVPRLCTLEISLRGPAEGAPVQVSLDDEPLAPASIGVPRVLNPGPHTVVAESPGFKTERRSFELAEGAREKMTLALFPLPPHCPHRQFEQHHPPSCHPRQPCPLLGGSLRRWPLHRRRHHHRPPRQAALRQDQGAMP